MSLRAARHRAHLQAQCAATNLRAAAARLCVLACLLASAGAAGCASSAAAPPAAASDALQGERPTARPERSEEESPDGSAAQSEWSALAASLPTRDVWLPKEDGVTDGIVVLRWQVPDDPSVIGAFFDAHAPSMLTEEAQDRLRSNGFRVAQVQVNDLASALDALGGTASSVRVWLGQAHAWTQVNALAVRGQAAVLVDGSTRRFEGGSLQLLVRGWTVPLERGAVTDLELRPAFMPGGAVPGARATAREGFAAAGFSVALERGTALLVVSAPHRMSAAGSGPSAGPPVLPPATLGELLLARAGRPQDILRLRPVVVLAPLLADRHFEEPATVGSPPPQPTP